MYSSHSSSHVRKPYTTYNLYIATGAAQHIENLYKQDYEWNTIVESSGRDRLELSSSTKEAHLRSLDILHPQQFINAEIELWGPERSPKLEALLEKLKRYEAIRFTIYICNPVDPDDLRTSLQYIEELLLPLNVTQLDVNVKRPEGVPFPKELRDKFQYEYGRSCRDVQALIHNLKSKKGMQFIQFGDPLSFHKFNWNAKDDIF